MYIKGFKKDLTCRNYQFEIGKEYDTGKTNNLKLCNDTVFHFCKTLEQVDNYYGVNKGNRYCEIEVLGELIEDDDKCGSNKIRIVREIIGEELNEMLHKTRGNTGVFNTGDYNTGNRNTGNGNTGDYNTGNGNTGDFNTGDYNTGNGNTGDYNTGVFNTGDYNTGNRNTGNGNTGDLNTGNFNQCNHSTGFFNTKERTITIFNIDSGMTYDEFIQSVYGKALIQVKFHLTEWIYYSDEEKADSDIKKRLGGYLKEYTYKEACNNWWNKLTDENKMIIQNIPNFNKEIFEEITGIKLERKEYC